MFPAEQSGELGPTPWITSPLPEEKNWQSSFLTWQYAYEQEYLEVLILLACEGTGPVWIDNVTVTYAT